MSGALGPENVASADSVAKGQGPSNEHEKALDFANYFSSYGYIYHQKDMLQVRIATRSKALQAMSQHRPLKDAEPSRA